MIYAFDDFELDDQRRTLRCGGDAVAIQARVFALLLYLVQRRGRMVSREELLRSVWADSVVSATALSRAVKEARRAIDDDGDRQRRVRTLHGEGFSFEGAVLVGGEPAAPAASGRAPLIGRGDTLARLEAALANALAGRGSFVLLGGEPGLGKTRTAEELAERACERGALVLWGRSWEGAGAPALWPWIQAVRARARILDEAAHRAEAGPAATGLALLVPELAPALGVSALPESEGDAVRFRIFDGVASFLRGIASREPLLLVLDDLHCADAASLGLARFLARDLAGARLLVLATHRDREWAGPAGQREALFALAREPGCEALALAPFDTAETRALAEQLVAAPIAEPVAHALHERAKGNPLFIAETLRHWLDEGLLDPARGVATLPPERLPLGRGVRELIERRVAALGPACQRLLESACVLGRRFDRELLRALPGLRRAELREALRVAQAERVLRDCEREPGALEFSHALVRESLYYGLPAERRAELHRAAGETLEKLAGDEPGPHLERLAHHFLEAAALGEPGKAVAYARRAAERAAARGAYEEAASLLERAVALAAHDEESAEPARTRLLVALGEAQARAGGPARARATLTAAAELATQAGRHELLARAALAFGTSGMGLTDPLALDEAQVRLLEAALAAQAERETDAAVHARLGARLALVRYWPSAEPRCVALADEAVARARRSGDAGALAQALLAAYVTRVGPDRVSECPPLGAELARVSAERVSPELAFLARSVRLRELLATGERAAFAREVTALEQETRELRQPQLRWWALVLASAAPLIEGRYDDSLALAKQALALGERMGDPTATSTYGGQAFYVALDRGRPERAEANFRKSAAERPGSSLFPAALAFLEAETGRHDEARRSVAWLLAGDAAAIRRDYAWWTALAFLAEAVHRTGDAEQAAALERLLAPHAGRHAVFGLVSLYYNGPVSRSLGLLALARGEPDRACARFEAAEAEAAGIGAAPMGARVQADHAAALLARGASGDAAAAHALARKAAEAARDLGMPRLLERAEGLLRRSA